MRRCALIGIAGATLVVICSYLLTNPLVATYHTLQSSTLYDRHGTPINISLNDQEQYNLYAKNYPDSIVSLLIQKEDRFFYYHPGINPFSIVRTIFSGISTDEFGGSSTLTQQLVKMLLANEQDRSYKNKLIESIYALALEVRFSKREILTMYLNAAAFGNQAQGLATASFVYYNKPVTELSIYEQLSLLGTLNQPSVQNPWSEDHRTAITHLADRLAVENYASSDPQTGFTFNHPAAASLGDIASHVCASQCATTIDAELSESIRSIAQDHVNQTRNRGATDAAVVVLSVPNNELLAVIGSPDPFGQRAGAQINMATEPRPIGSTIKPFIYGSAFELGARPYTLIDDREYKYNIGTGFPLYPKNYDGNYYGTVTLQHALANSLNTPSIKLLEFVTLEQFYTFLEDDLAFESINPLDSYAYGIALGGLEMDLLTLTHYFSLLANQGTLQPMHITINDIVTPPQHNLSESRTIFAPQTVELINSILTNRAAGTQQFGLKSTLDVPNKTVAVKTGTSRDFHDSWTVGYTPDYVVGVWVGNTENKPMRELSGAVGAGNLWRRVMELLATTAYDTGATFTYPHTVPIGFDNTTYQTLPQEDTLAIRTMFDNERLILSPHDGDTLLFSTDTAIPLRSADVVDWFIDGTFHTNSSGYTWRPTTAGEYTITAHTELRSETITVSIVASSRLPQ